MLKIKNFTLENFRGIKFQFTVPFYKNGKPTSTVIYGRNGTGKSSLMEAWEWLNKFHIDKLKREGVTPKDFPHKACDGDNCFVQVDFVDDEKKIDFVKVLFNNSKISIPIISGQFTEFKLKDRYPNYLKYSDLQEFVFMSKTEKYNYLTNFFGLDIFTKNQSELRTYINKLPSKILHYEDEIYKSESTLTTITGKSNYGEDAIVSYVNKIAQKYNFNQIQFFKEIKKIIVELKKIIDTNTTAKELADWKNFQENVDSYYSIELPQSILDSTQFSFNELKKSEQEITKLVLSNLYNSAIDIIPKLENKDQCPLCDTGFKGNLFEYIKEKYDNLSELRIKKDNFETQQKIILKICNNIIDKINILQTEKNLTITSSFNVFLNEVKSIYESLNCFKELFSNDVLEISELNLSKENFVAKLQESHSRKLQYSEIINKKVSELEKDERSKSLSDDYENLLNIMRAYFIYIISHEKKAFLEDLKEKLEGTFEHLTNYIQDLLQTTFTALSENVIEYFLFLESSNSSLTNPQLKLLTGKDKAVELEIEFANEKISPALKILSESQINSFGLSIFLASVKHYNREFKFFILDDVVNSFDGFKRTKIAQLLSTKFQDFQILLLTHDKVFFDTIQMANPNWNRLKFVGWDYATGPKHGLALNYGEEIINFLDNDNAVSAGQALGRYLELILGVLNERMQTPITYKIENIYTLIELFAPYKARCGSKLKTVKNNEHLLNKKLRELADSLIFRNYCVHWKNEENPLTSSEIREIHVKWLLIEQIIFCGSCSSFVKYTKVKDQEYIKCDCGQIDLKAEKYYE